MALAILVLQMIVTTPEKWDVITRKGGEVSVAATVSGSLASLLAYVLSCACAGCAAVLCCATSWLVTSCPHAAAGRCLFVSLSSGPPAHHR